ncbi:MAG: TraV family lipoprotein [Deferribacteraceae bacterium]|jgi:hypothetical protein|nr:TraV family lipoprotein [Deferribacteraceae bacterium]
MKIKKFLIPLTALCLFSCSGKNVRHIISLENQTIEMIITNKKLNNEQKVAMIKSQMLNELDDEKPELQKERDVRLSEIIKKPVSPLKSPDKVLRILILPYSDTSKVLHTWKYNFITIDEGQWIIGDYLNNTSRQPKTLTPLNRQSEIKQ